MRNMKICNTNAFTDADVIWKIGKVSPLRDEIYHARELVRKNMRVTPKKWSRRASSAVECEEMT